MLNKVQLYGPSHRWQLYMWENIQKSIYLKLLESDQEWADCGERSKLETRKHRVSFPFLCFMTFSLRIDWNHHYANWLKCLKKTSCLSGLKNSSQGKHKFWSEGDGIFWKEDRVREGKTNIHVWSLFKYLTNSWNMHA